MARAAVHAVCLPVTHLWLMEPNWSPSLSPGPTIHHFSISTLPYSWNYDISLSEEECVLNKQPAGSHRVSLSNANSLLLEEKQRWAFYVEAANDLGTLKHHLLNPAFLPVEGPQAISWIRLHFGVFQQETLVLWLTWAEVKPCCLVNKGPLLTDVYM